MSAELFPTITGAHWRAMFSRARSEGRAEGSAMLFQIRAATARLQSLRRDIPTAHAQGGAADGSGVGSQAPAGPPQNIFRSQPIHAKANDACADRREVFSAPILGNGPQTTNA